MEIQRVTLPAVLDEFIQKSNIYTENVLHVNAAPTFHSDGFKT